MRPSSLKLDFSGIELLIVRYGSNLALLQVVNTVSLDFSGDNLSFLDSKASCKMKKLM